MDNITCDICSKDIHLEAKDIHTKIIDDIQVQYFQCKHCNHKYITTCIDEYVRKEQRRYQKILKDIQDIQDLIRITTRNKKVKITKHDKKLDELKDKKLRCLENMKMYSDRLCLKIKDKLY